MKYVVIFVLGGLSALGYNFSSTKQSAISGGGVATSSGIVIGGEETVRVARVIDGDTIELAGGKRVRYIGIDTPEVGDGRTAVECFAREAMEENRRLVEGKTVRLKKDVSETDQYGRLLRYVYIDDLFVNDHLVRQGFARVATFPPDVTHQEQFFVGEREAREQRRGLWNACSTSNTSKTSKSVGITE